MSLFKARYDTDKFQNTLIDKYKSIFKSLKNKKIIILEIGINKGGSLKFWSDYFKHPQSKVIGLDIKLPTVDFPEKVAVYKCDQNDSTELKKIADQHGLFDIIIDDGSHQKKETKNCFNILFDYVAAGGYYVIEDWAVGYPGTSTYEEKYKGMVDLVNEIIKNALSLRIKWLEVLMNSQGSVAFFQKE